jgi:hypothetical protein
MDLKTGKIARRFKGEKYGQIIQPKPIYPVPLWSLEHTSQDEEEPIGPSADVQDGTARNESLNSEVAQGPSLWANKKFSPRIFRLMFRRIGSQK